MNMNNYVLITGATGGLGKAFAAECASRGWDLLLTDLSEEKLALVAAGLERMHGVNVQYYACDLTNAASRESLWQIIQQRGLRFHMLLNVAGIDYQGAFDERQVNELTTIVRLNIEATVEMMRRILQFKGPHRRLQIVNVSSLAAFYPMPVKAVYAASKRFLLDLSLALNRELQADDVTVTALCPAGMPTNPDCIRSIEAQGFMGQITTKNVGAVAARTIDLALAGRSVYIPGFINQVLWFLGSLVPPAVITYLINKRWQAADQKAHGHTRKTLAHTPAKQA